jgi:hypothetical protein
MDDRASLLRQTAHPHFLGDGSAEGDPFLACPPALSR